MRMKYIIGAVLLVASIVGGYSYFTQSNGVGGGLGTIDQLGQWFFDGTNITQNTADTPIKLTGYESSGDCLVTDTNGVVSTATCGGGGGGSSKWEQVGSFLQPLVAYVTNGIRGSYFVATSTTATSTFPNINSNKIQAGSSAGLTVFSNNGSAVSDFGAGGGNNASFFGGVNIAGQTQSSNFVANSTTSTSTFAGAVTMSGWALSTSTVVCRAPEKCQFQADGINDNVQIQAALDTNTPVTIKNGIYSINQTITMNAGDSLIGSGYNTVLVATSSLNDSIIENTDLVSETDTNLTIGNLRVDGNKANQSSASTVNGIEFTNVNEFYLHDLWLENTAYDGARINSSDNGRFDQIEASGNTDMGIQIFNGSANHLITNYTAKNNSDSGLRVNGASKVQVTTMFANGNGQDGIKIDNGATYVKVTNAYLNDNDDGIHVRDDSDFFQFENITATNNDKNGILIQDCHNWSVKGLYSAYNKFNGIGISGSTNWNISNITARNNNQEDLGNNYVVIKVNDNTGASSSAGQITNSRAYDDQATKTQAYGIQFEDNTDYITVTNSDFRGNEIASMSLVGTNNAFSGLIVAPGEDYKDGFFKKSATGLFSLTQNFLGLGISEPERQLHVAGTSSGATLGLVRIQNTNTANNTGSRLAFTNTTATGVDHAGFQAIRTNSPSSESTALTFNTTLNSGARFYEAMRLTPAGFLGINTSVPSTSLHVVGTTTTTDLRVTNLVGPRAVFVDASGNATSGAASASLITSLSDETGTGVAVFGTSPAFTTSITTPSTSFTALAGATTLLTLGGTGASASTNFPSTLDTTSSVTGAIRTAGGISAAKALNIGTTGTFGTQIITPIHTGSTTVSGTLTLKSTSGAGTSDAIIFQVGNNGAREAGRISTLAQWSIGTTSSSSLVTIASTTAPSALDVFGTTTLRNGVAMPGLLSSTAGNAICILGSTIVNAGGTTCVTSSERFKTDIALLTDWRDIFDIDVVEYNYKPEYADNVRDAGGKRLGFIAEQIESVNPQLVQYDTEGNPLSVHFDGITALTVQAVQDLQHQIDGITGKAQKSAQDKWQWVVIAMLFFMVAGQQYQIYKLKK